MVRKTFFVKPKLQFKYIFMSILVTVVSTGVVYLTLSHVFFASGRLTGLSSLEIASFQRSIRFFFVLILLLLIVAIGLENMFRFHRLAGPIYVIERIIKTIGSGDLTQEFHLRKDDELKDLAEELSAMRDGLKSFVANDRKTCRDVQAKLDRILALLNGGAPSPDLKKEIESIRKDLDSISSQFKV